MTHTQIIPGYSKLYVEELYVSARWPELVKRGDMFKPLHLTKQNFIAHAQFRPLRSFAQEAYPDYPWIIIPSGYCGLQLNLAIGRSNDSEHLWERDTAAWDFVVREPTGKMLRDCFVWAQTNIPFGQLIYEHDHVHVSLPTANHSMEVIEL